jgi:MFS family permease
MALWLPIGGILLCAPLYIGTLLMADGQSALLMLIPTFILGALWTAPSIALTQSLAPVAMRARASAVYIVAANLIGVSMGPLVAGMLSDWFAHLRGGGAAMGLRDALMSITFFFVLGAWHWTSAARTLRSENETTTVPAAADQTNAGPT